jgi:hypothetical protein
MLLIKVQLRQKDLKWTTQEFNDAKQSAGSGIVENLFFVVPPPEEHSVHPAPWCKQMASWACLKYVVL